jgi:uncharacterized protein (TIGR00299 family) protein
MTRVAYFDLANGISGDMILGALAHAGRTLRIDVERTIIEAVDAIPLECTVSFVDDERGGIACVRAEVKTGDARHTASQLRDAMASHPRAVSALDLLVAAEARVHGVDPNDVHLHELASADTAADLVGAAVGLAALDVERVAAASVPVPHGWITAGHGELPLPAPATLEVLRGALLHGVDGEKELVTPSGAAILVAHDATFGTMPEMVLDAVGVGAGTRITPRPNVSRVLIGEAVEVGGACVLLEANIDDQTPEALGHAVTTLIATGALDAWVTPIVMKKSRPAFLLSVLTTADDEALVAEAFFRYTTTIGVRRRIVDRHTLDRESVVVDIDRHDVRVKIARLHGEIVNIAPEFDDCAHVADVIGSTPMEILARATERARLDLFPS